MCPATLDAVCKFGITPSASTLALRFPAVTHDNSLESPRQNLYQKVRAPTLPNHDKSLCQCGECPYPVLLSLNFDRGFINMQNRSIANSIQNCVIFQLNRIGSTASEIQYRSVTDVRVHTAVSARSGSSCGVGDPHISAVPPEQSYCYRICLLLDNPDRLQRLLSGSVGRSMRAMCSGTMMARVFALRWK